jgi:tripartite-type tricarboxylate transporter receptor subunit TctC
MMIDGVPAEMKNIQTGVVRALAVTTETRSPALPDVPTVGSAPAQLDAETRTQFALYRKIVADNPALLAQ